MKKIGITLLAALLLLSILYSFIFCFAVPKAALFSLPFKWKNIPLGEKRSIVHSYLGKPDTAGMTEDGFKITTDNNYYLLKVDYNKDTVAEHFTIFYYYNSWLLNIKYQLKKQDL